MPTDVHDMNYYSKCMVGGILSCGLTHTFVCPLDIVKCRKQVRSHQLLPSITSDANPISLQANPKLYKSMTDGFKTIYRTEGLSGFKVVSTSPSICSFITLPILNHLLQGWAPTLIGYSMQGFGKFGFYEIFKDVYKGLLGPNAAKYQTLGFLTASACAEVIADCLLCPMESVRIFSNTFKFLII